MSLDDPRFATDATYTHGPVVGQPNKTAPTGAAEGFIPGAPLPADFLNYLLNNQGNWLRALVDAALFGPGTDGAATFDGTAVPAGTAIVTDADGVHRYFLQRDVFYTNVTFTNGAQLVVGGFRLFWNGTLDTTASTVTAGVWVIGAPGYKGEVGGGAGDGGPGGNRFGALPSSALGFLGTGGDGGVGQSAAPSGAGASTTHSIGGVGGAGGAGASEPAGAGGAATALTAVNGAVSLSLWQLLGFVIGSSGQLAPQGGGGGGAGGGNLTNNGGGGAGGGGVAGLCGNIISLRAATDISVAGGAGTNNTTQAGRGGGGGGGGGGLILIYAKKIGGYVFSAAVNCAGGAGGAGGSGAAAGTGGSVGKLFEFALG